MRGIAGWLTATATALMLNVMLSCPAAAWGDEGHEVVALIAQTRLDPVVRRKVDALLAADTDPLTAHTIIAAATTWPDKLRDSSENGARQKTSRPQPEGIFRQLRMAKEKFMAAA